MSEKCWLVFIKKKSIFFLCKISIRGASLIISGLVDKTMQTFIFY